MYIDYIDDEDLSATRDYKNGNVIQTTNCNVPSSREGSAPPTPNRPHIPIVFIFACEKTAKKTESASFDILSPLLILLMKNLVLHVSISCKCRNGGEYSLSMNHKKQNTLICPSYTNTTN